MGSDREDAVGQLDLIGRRIDADVASAQVGLPAVRFIRYGEWVDQLGSDADPDEPVCVCGGRSFPVSLVEGGEGALVRIADQLADEVMDRVAHPWPQVLVGGTTHVLQAVLDETGLAVWASSDGQMRCPVGFLNATFGRVGAL